ncbi:hypothetical protein H0I76_10000 [Limibaculum sp. M0105]|uniref:FlgO domain-containing protein n=1 Tax=Thermohalobaculum xanthum TaxID=2753746 RepID=A0A8J7M709_9RHOB|nr:FlgO family outer membrane protein [Thermohalobaculum xanthum]MBK0399524.1 hypothetical protein [Thermohalobaculum xanthum]
MAQLERTLSSEQFQASERRRDFLRFIVEETLAGRGSRLKGYTIAVEVFGRDDSFDPQTDPVVRLEARRLRRDLDGYYVSAGRNDAVLISMPKGSYVPRFEWQEGTQPSGAGSAGSDPPLDEGATVEPASGTAPRRKMPALGLLSAGLGIVLAIGAALSWLLITPADEPPARSAAFEPAIVVTSFTTLDAAEDSRRLAEGIQQELIGSLMKFPGFRVYVSPTASTVQANGGIELARKLGVAYVVTGSVTTTAEQIHVASQLVEAETGRVLWTEGTDAPLAPATFAQVLRDLSGDIATALGQPYGIVANDLRLRAETPSVSSMQSYICVLRAYGYRRSFSKTEFQPVFDCLREAVRRDPGYSDAWAMLGWLHLDAGRYEFTGLDELPAQYNSAFSAASRAVALEPQNPLALKALSSINHYMGHYDEAERLARQAVALNPHDPDALAQLGWRLAVRGKFEEGIALLNHAIDRSARPPGWYYHLIAVSHCLNHDYEQMLHFAKLSAVDGSAVSYALLAIANGELGKAQEAQRALAAMSKFEPLARDPAVYFRRHGAIDQIVDALMSGLEKARKTASSG